MVSVLTENTHEGMPNLTEWEKWMRGGNGGIKGGRHIMLL